MINEGWSLADAIAFAKEYKLNISVTDKNNTILTEDQYNNLKDATIIEQTGRLVGDPIIEGMTFKVKINAELEIQTEEEDIE